MPPPGWSDGDFDELVRSVSPPSHPEDIARLAREVAARDPAGPRRRGRRGRIVLTLTGVAAGVAVVAVALTTGGGSADGGPADGSEQLPAERTESVPAAIDGVDTSPVLTETLSGSLEVVAARLGAMGGPVTLTPENVYPPDGRPDLEQFPVSAPWRFSVAAAHREECRAMVTDRLTVRGFAGGLQRTPSGTVAMSVIELGSPDEAAEFLTGRTIALGVTPETCRVEDGEVVVDHRVVPGVVAPAWAEEFHSFELRGPTVVLPGEQQAQGYLLREGARVWEVRLGSDDTLPPPATISRLLEATADGR